MCVLPSKDESVQKSRTNGGENRKKQCTLAPVWIINEVPDETSIFPFLPVQCLCVFRQMLVSKEHRKLVMIQQTLCSLVYSRLEAHVLVFSHHLFSSKHTPVSFFSATKRSNNSYSRFVLKFKEIDCCTVFHSKDLPSPNWIVGSYEKIIFWLFSFLDCKHGI